MTMKKIMAVVLAVAMGVLMAACGNSAPATTAAQGGGETQPQATEAAPATTAAPAAEVSQGVTDDTILVGNTAATTGSFATVGVPFNAGLEATFKEFNDAGGFEGRSIKLVHYDDGFDGAQGLTYTKQLVETDKVFAIVGHFGTNTVGATLDYLKEMGTPMVYAATGISELYQEGATGNAALIYPVQPIYNAEGRVLLARALAKAPMGLEGTKIGAISTTDDAGAGLLEGVKRQAEDTPADITYQEVEPAATDYSAAVNVLKNAGCDVVVACMNQAPLATLMASMRDANFDTKVITSYVSASVATLGAFVENGSVTATRPVYCTAWLDVTSEEGAAEYAAFATAMGAWEVENGMSGTEYAVNSYAMAGYIAGNIFVQSLNRMLEAGVALNWDNYNAIMEAAPFNIPMGGTVNYANGDRLGVVDLALNTISLEFGETGYYELQQISPITTLDEVLAEVK